MWIWQDSLQAGAVVIFRQRAFVHAKDNTTNLNDAWSLNDLLMSSQSSSFLAARTFWQHNSRKLQHNNVKTWLIMSSVDAWSTSHRHTFSGWSGLYILSISASRVCHFLHPHLCPAHRTKILNSNMCGGTTIRKSEELKIKKTCTDLLTYAEQNFSGQLDCKERWGYKSLWDSFCQVKLGNYVLLVTGWTVVSQRCTACQRPTHFPGVTAWYL